MISSIFKELCLRWNLSDFDIPFDKDMDCQLLPLEKLMKKKTIPFKFIKACTFITKNVRKMPKLLQIYIVRSILENLKQIVWQDTNFCEKAGIYKEKKRILCCIGSEKDKIVFNESIYLDTRSMLMVQMSCLESL